jgi:hypothetical protein
MFIFLQAPTHIQLSHASTKLDLRAIRWIERHILSRSSSGANLFAAKKNQVRSRFHHILGLPLDHSGNDGTGTIDVAVPTNHRDEPIACSVMIIVHAHSPTIQIVATPRSPAW